MADAAAAPRRVRLFLATERKDRWWLEPLLTLTILLTFIGYANWAAYQGEHYWYGPYLSPFYSPELLGNSPHAWFGPSPTWWPTSILPYSAAWLILIFPLGFRLTCYYYRGAYYKAFWSRASTTSASATSRSSSRTSTATSCTRRWCSS
jgi:hypothetical protein